MNSSLQAALEDFVAREKLPASYLQTVERWFAPLADAVLRKAAVITSTLIVALTLVHL